MSVEGGIMARHIGITACSAEGAAICYRTICTEGAEMIGHHDHPEITLHTLPLRMYLSHITEGDWESVSRLIIASAEKLHASGADFFICPDNMLHRVYDTVSARAPMTWINIADVVVREASVMGYTQPGVIATKALLESQVYSSRLAEAGIPYVTPDAAARDRIDHIIYDELVLGRVDEGGCRYLLHTVERLEQKGCDSVILGSSLLPIAITPDVSPLPILDSPRLLAREALRIAIGYAEPQQIVHT